MKMRHLLLLLGFAVAGLLGYWLAGTAVPRMAQRGVEKPEGNAPWQQIEDEQAPKFRGEERERGPRRDYAAAIAGAFEGQRLLVFKDADAMAKFLARAGGKVRLLGKIDQLHALRVGFSNYDDLAGLLDGGADPSYVFPVSIPTPKDGTVQPGAVPVGSHLLDFLGVTGDNSSWGKGVRIAVLDTGVTANSAFNANISAINLVDLPTDLSQQNGHGTAVASMIIGGDSLTPGVAPAADILSIRIADDNGQSDSYLLAKGIITAADAGVSLINISMGSQGDSPLVRDAIAYATAKGALIFAAAGNNGVNGVDFPAADPGVIAVGAVDLVGIHLDFSNTGSQIALSAPGYALNAAWTGDQIASVSGTSFSSPIVLASVAGLMSQPGYPQLTAAQAYQLLVSYLNAGTAPGADTSALGGGTPDIGRVLNRNTPGIYDAALAGIQLLAPDAGNPYGQAEILVQNRGTEPLVNTKVQVSVGGGVISSNITQLAPNAVAAVNVPVNYPPAGSNPLTVDANVSLSAGVGDSKPSNNHRVATYVPAKAP